jgi:transcriptional regulator
MYIAPHSREERRGVLLSAIQDIHFGALVVSHDSGIEASHLPMLVREEPGEPPILEGHVSRWNPLWRLISDGPALAIFQGPQAYVHPGWYPTKKRDGRAVPTWNYIAVHAHGNVTVVEDRSWLTRHLAELTEHNEGHRPEPWSMSDAPADFIGALMKGVIGLRFTINKIEGNWKLAQKQPLENRLGAAAGLAGSARASDREVGALMATVAPSGS